jgi:hypothetical protein
MRQRAILEQLPFRPEWDAFWDHDAHGLKDQ